VVRSFEPADEVVHLDENVATPDEVDGADRDG